MRRILISIFLVLTLPAIAQVNNIFVSPKGDDKNTGILARPVQTLERALSLSEMFAGKQVSIQLMGGTYYLEKTVKIQPSVKFPSKLEIKAFENQKVILSAGRVLKPDWRHFHSGIYSASLPPGISFERLFVNGALQTMARYPNMDSTAKVFKGTAEDATYYVRVLTWGNPSGGYVHGLDEGRKGSLHYRITGVDDTDNVELDGGWQYKYPGHMDKRYHFVENVLGELDTPGEWYLDKSINMLYYYPTTGLDLTKAVIEVSNLKKSMELTGTAANPLRNVTLKNLWFCHNERTFMHSRDTLTGSDWAVYRGGAVVLEGTENCKIEDCNFTVLGGNAIVFNGYNRNDQVTGTLVSHVGANAVSFFSGDVDPNVSGKSSDCLIENNLFQYVGQLEKQGTGIHLNGASGIEIRQNTVYHAPGTGIKIENMDVKTLKLDLNQMFGEYQEISPGTARLDDSKKGAGISTGVQKQSLKRLVLSVK